VKRTLSLEPGDNKIEVVAYNAKGLIASEPAQVSVKWDGATTATPPTLYVLAVGVNDYVAVRNVRPVARAMHGVFTYALLDALDRADVNKNGLIEVSELADYIDQKVPDYSYEAFKLRQIPQRSIVGNNFALTNKTEVLTTTPVTAKTDAAAIPPKPTHVVVVPVDVYEQFAGQGTKFEQLPVGTLLSLVKTDRGWALVARDGKQLGYVTEDRLMRVQ
jgi:hypothetical protein